MNLYRVIMSVHRTNGMWQSSSQIPTFYVHGVTPEIAKQQALSVVTLAGTPERGTSGSLIQVDSNLDACGNDTYLSWNDLK